MVYMLTRNRKRSRLEDLSKGLADKTCDISCSVQCQHISCQTRHSNEYAICDGEYLPFEKNTKPCQQTVVAADERPAQYLVKVGSHSQSLIAQSQVRRDGHTVLPNHGHHRTTVIFHNRLRVGSFRVKRASGGGGGKCH